MNSMQDRGWGAAAQRRSATGTSDVIRHSVFVIFALLLVFTVAACGSGITQTAQTQRYTVGLTLDSASFGERTATIVVNDRAGQPAAVDEVVLTPVMESMGMAIPRIRAVPAFLSRTMKAHCWSRKRATS